jgi:hypothetical protein
MILLLLLLASALQIASPAYANPALCIQGCCGLKLVLSSETLTFSVSSLQPESQGDLAAVKISLPSPEIACCPCPERILNATAPMQDKYYASVKQLGFQLIGIRAILTSGPNLIRAKAICTHCHQPNCETFWPLKNCFNDAPQTELPICFYPGQTQCIQWWPFFQPYPSSKVASPEATETTNVIPTMYAPLNIFPS